MISSLKKAHTSSQKYFHHPLLVMNNFNSEEKHLKLTESALQNMFPAVNVNTVLFVLLCLRETLLCLQLISGEIERHSTMLDVRLRCRVRSNNDASLVRFELCEVRRLLLFKCVTFQLYKSCSHWLEFVGEKTDEKEGARHEQVLRH